MDKDTKKNNKKVPALRQTRRNGHKDTKKRKKKGSWKH